MKISYQLVLSEIFDEKTKDVGENIFFDDLLIDYQVYLLYYPSTRSKPDLANELRNLGSITGKNLFVNIGRLDDPNYVKISKLFGIKKYPTIIMTAIDKLASPPDEYSTAFVKIDNKKLLDSTDLILDCIDKIFNLFISGRISEAIRVKNRETRVYRIKNIIKDSLLGMRDFLKEWDVSFSFISGKLELKHKG